MQARYLNENGEAQVRDFILAHRKNIDYLMHSERLAYSNDVDFQLAEGNPPTVEIPALYSRSGVPVTYTVTAEGVDTLDITEDEI